MSDITASIDDKTIDFDASTIMLVAGAAPFSTRDVWEGYAESFQDYGANILPYPTFSMLELFSSDLLGSDLIGKAIDVRNAVSVVVFISGMYFRDKRSWVVESLTRRRVPTVLIATDDPYHETGPDNLYSIRFTNELSCATDEVGYLPTATVVPPHFDDGPWVRDLVFVGTLFEDRCQLIQDIAMYCELNGHRFDIFGNLPARVASLADMEFVRLFPGTVSPERKWNIYAQSKLVLNVFRSGKDIEPLSANPRTYEVAAMGRPALITDYRKECDDIFGDSVYTFQGMEQFQQQLETALASESHRADRVARAQEIVLSSHLYLHRTQRLMEVIKDKIL